MLSNERTRPQKGTWFHWGSNPGPSACKADVITATLWNLDARASASDGEEGERGALGHADVCLYDVMTSRKATCPRNRVRRRGKETGLPSVLCSAVFGRGRMGVDSRLASLYRAWTEFPPQLLAESHSVAERGGFSKNEARIPQGEVALLFFLKIFI